jgi:Fe-coproporphyrin III synthase
MVGISRLYCGTEKWGDQLRYGAKDSAVTSDSLAAALAKKPIVVWNVSQRCNLRCIHCYSDSDGGRGSNDLTTDEGKRLIDDLVAFGAPVLLFSGGEPLMRPDVPDLIEYASSKGIRVVISTNGTLIEDAMAKRLKNGAVSYVGVSLDGAEQTHDAFRRSKGAFKAAIEGIRASKRAGLKTGLRFTITKRNATDIPSIFEVALAEGVPRVCFYHLVYTGRGKLRVEDTMPIEESRRVVDYIIDRTARINREGSDLEVLTVDNHCDGPYLYLRMKKEKHPHADDALALLMKNGGNSSGVAISCVSWDGTVYPDQFWRHYPLGNVRQRAFGDIWTDVSDPFFKQLKEKKNYVKGRCATCRFLPACGGNFRVRAEAMTGNVWAPDPACYLTDEEIKKE